MWNLFTDICNKKSCFNLRASLDVKGKRRWEMTSLISRPSMTPLSLCPSKLYNAAWHTPTTPTPRWWNRQNQRQRQKTDYFTFSTFYLLNLLKIGSVSNCHNHNCNISPLFISSALRPSLSLHNLASVTFTEVLKRTIYQCHFTLLLSSLSLITCPALQPKKVWENNNTLSYCTKIQLRWHINI